ncbi:MAG TPA: helix-turn-helix domain-containing protein [Planctomycetota bacterium]|nr:helix-turn-helix domain-containing protein [Planctomycetota bacterium]
MAKGVKKKQASGEEPTPELMLAKEVLSHPIRIRLFGMLRQSRPRTQSELAKCLGLSNAAVHYHLNLMAGVGLVKLAGTRPGPNSITEKLYAFENEKWKSLSPNPAKDDSEMMLDYTMSWIHEMHRHAGEIIKKQWGIPFLVGSYHLSAPPGEITKLRKQINRLTEDFKKTWSKEKSKESVPVAITFGVLPSTATTWPGTTVFSWGECE